jgi:hypothetical protein
MRNVVRGYLAADELARLAAPRAFLLVAYGDHTLAIFIFAPRRIRPRHPRGHRHRRANLVTTTTSSTVC